MYDLLSNVKNNIRKFIENLDLTLSLFLEALVNLRTISEYGF